MSARNVATAKDTLIDPVPLLCCSIAGRSFAVPVALVERVFRWPLPEPSGFVPSAMGPVTSARHAVAEPAMPAIQIAGLLGVIATADAERPVLDPRARYDDGATQETDRSRLLTCAAAGFPIALVVDAVFEVVTADAARMQLFDLSLLAPPVELTPTTHAGHEPARRLPWPILAVLEVGEAHVSAHATAHATAHVTARDTALVFVLDVARLLTARERALCSGGVAPTVRAGGWAA